MSKVAEITFKKKVKNENADFDVMYIIDSLYWNGQIYNKHIIEENEDIFKKERNLVTIILI